MRHRIALDHTDGSAPFLQRSWLAYPGKVGSCAVWVQNFSSNSVKLTVTGDFQDVINASAGDIGDEGGNLGMTVVDHMGGA